MSVFSLVKNPGFIASIEAGAAYKEFRHQVGESVKQEVEAIAPIGATGEYHRSIVVLEDGAVGTTDPFGHLVEWGSVNNRAYAPLRRGVKNAGLTLREEPKPS